MTPLSRWMSRYLPPRAVAPLLWLSYTLALCATVLLFGYDGGQQILYADIGY